MELKKLPVHNGIINFKITKTSFLMLNVLNDDSSVVKHFWQGSHDLLCLDLWYDLSLKNGSFIDVGAHTGLYTLTNLRANKENDLICFEPHFMNMSRLITNLRINGLDKKASTILAAASNFSGKTNFNVLTDKSYLSKGGRIDKDGEEVNVYALDDIYFEKLKKPLQAIKIDTEGEDYKVLLGAERLINEYKPKIIIEVREENKLEINSFFLKYNYQIFNVSNLEQEIDLSNTKIDNIANFFAK
tara:strand:- start:297 stop:1028 length:732 start_codon:yes stop_codon:yes gene_type:complete